MFRIDGVAFAEEEGMDITFLIATTAAAAIVIVAAAAYAVSAARDAKKRRERREGLGFGPEYHGAIARRGNSGAGQEELRDRQKRAAQINPQPIPSVDAPENLDPFVALWSMCNALRRDRLPDRRVVIQFDFTGRQRRERYWLLIEIGDTEICKTYPGLDEDLYITAEAEAFVKWHAGQLSWAAAIRDRRIQLHGPSWLARAFPTWNARSMFAHIKPASPSGASSAG